MRSEGVRRFDARCFCGVAEVFVRAELEARDSKSGGWRHRSPKKKGRRCRRPFEDVSEFD
jgi:hypothetical protein